MKRLFQTLVFYYPAELLQGSHVKALSPKSNIELVNYCFKYAVFKVQIMTEREWRIKQKKGFWTDYVTAQQDNEMEEQQKRGQYHIIFH